MNKRRDYTKYKNPDPRCTYPFGNRPLGYCWGYANYVEGRPGYVDLKRICETCPYWNISDKRVTKRLKAENAQLRGEEPIPESWWKECPKLAQKTMEGLIAENKRMRELLDRYRICVMCGKQLSAAEADSVHSCYDEQALKDSKKGK